MPGVPFRFDTSGLTSCFGLICPQFTPKILLKPVKAADTYYVENTLMWVRLLSYVMAAVAVGASFLLGHDRVLRIMDRYLPLRPKHPRVRPVVGISANFIDERTAPDLPAGFIPSQSGEAGYEHRL